MMKETASVSSDDLNVWKTEAKKRGLTIKTLGKGEWTEYYAMGRDGKCYGIKDPLDTGHIWKNGIEIGNITWSPGRLKPEI